METTAPAPITPAPSQPRFVRWAVVLGIVIVLNIFFVVLRTVVLPAPDINTYCPAAAQNVVANDAQSCDTAGGLWTDYGPVAPADQTAPQTPTGYCDFYAKCQPVFDGVNQKYELYAFSLSIVLGLLSIVAGVMLSGSWIVSSGLSYGGVLAFIVGSASYWSEASSLLKLAISAIALVALLYIGFKKFKD